MQGYEPGEIKPLQKQLSAEESPVQVGILTNSADNRESDYLDELAALEELQFLTGQCTAFAKPAKLPQLSDLTVDSKPEFDDSHQLQEQNRRLKRTLSERFKQEFAFN